MSKQDEFIKQLYYGDDLFYENTRKDSSKKCELNKIRDEVDIENINEEILDIIKDLKSTLEFGKGLGIAAPQIGIDKRIIVVGAKKENIKYNCYN